ncbi:thiamine phosphate synthase [Flexivirga sp. ID2601S]|uniref:Thiamine-phosphate synthase n=1 Tax=Flexivirga aerilata TaxID=1656889 RepID=A0A849AID1_9MICO|nr:thiamine phosphate synthase [Flexivirga aerilata]NNG40594.1 thiamine phosphate synthase [Flexivirga aerilata]
MDPKHLRIYLVTDEGLSGARGVVETVRQAVAGGVTIVQLRDHDASSRRLVETARQLLEVTRSAGVPFVVDDRLDVALAVGADGVHLGQSDLDPVDARRIAGPGFLIGHSVSSPDELRAADEWPAGTVDYLGIGPLRATTTKPNAAAPLGYDGVRAIAGATALPSVAIGGIGVGDVAPLLDAGVDGVAVVSAICAAADPAAAAAELRTAVERSAP